MKFHLNNWKGSAWITLNSSSTTQTSSPSARGTGSLFLDQSPSLSVSASAGHWRPSWTSPAGSRSGWRSRWRCRQVWSSRGRPRWRPRWPCTPRYSPARDRTTWSWPWAESRPSTCWGRPRRARWGCRGQGRRDDCTHRYSDRRWLSWPELPSHPAERGVTTGNILNSPHLIELDQVLVEEDLLELRPDGPQVGGHDEGRGQHAPHSHLSSGLKISLVIIQNVKSIINSIISALETMSVLRETVLSTLLRSNVKLELLQVENILRGLPFSQFKIYGHSLAPTLWNFKLK